jgi:hypothetical protein
MIRLKIFIRSYQLFFENYKQIKHSKYKHELDLIVFDRFLKK